MKPTVTEPTSFVLSLSASKNIYAGLLKEISDGEAQWATPVGEENDVTSDFYYILLALADMLDDSKAKGRFNFTMENGDGYEVTIKALSREQTL